DEILNRCMDEIDLQFQLHIAHIFSRDPKAGKRLSDPLLDGSALSLGLPAYPRPVLLKDPMHPHRHLKDEELDVLFRIMVSRPDRVSFAVSPATRIDDVEDRVGLPEVVKELVAQTLAFVRIRYKPCDIDKIHRHEAGAVNTVAAFYFQVRTRALCPHIPDTEVRVDGSERVIRDLSICHRGSLEKCRFSAVGFSRKSQG